MQDKGHNVETELAVVSVLQRQGRSNRTFEVKYRLVPYRRPATMASSAGKEIEDAPSILSMIHPLLYHTVFAILWAMTFTSPVMSSGILYESNWLS